MTKSQRAQAVVRELHRHAVALGGTVSAEHGLGKRKAHLLNLQYTAEQIESMKKVKKHLDPNWLLNRGNLFDEQCGECTLACRVATHLYALDFVLRSAHVPY